jgi:hypothetical protein
VKLLLDAEYVRNITVLKDLAIVLRTVKAILLVIMGKHQEVTVPEHSASGPEHYLANTDRGRTTRSGHVSNSSTSIN